MPGYMPVCFMRFDGLLARLRVKKQPQREVLCVALWQLVRNIAFQVLMASCTWYFDMRAWWQRHKPLGECCTSVSSVFNGQPDKLQCMHLLAATGCSHKAQRFGHKANRREVGWIHLNTARWGATLVAIVQGRFEGLEAIGVGCRYGLQSWAVCHLAIRMGVGSADF